MFFSFSSCSLLDWTKKVQKMVLTLILLALLFVVGLINSVFYLPTKKYFLAWFQYFFPNNPSTTCTTTTTTTIATNKDKRSAKLEKVFATFDKNGDGYITKQELRESLKNIGILMTEKEVEEMVEKLDRNGDGLIDLSEFCELCESMAVGEGASGDRGGKEEGVEEEDGGEMDLKEAFDVFDGNRDGLITVEELGSVLSSLGLKEGKRMEDCKKMIRKVDMDGDGMVNFDEFKRMMKEGGRLVSATL